MVEWLRVPSKREALSSNPSTAPKKGILDHVWWLTSALRKPAWATYGDPAWKRQKKERERKVLHLLMGCVTMQ
jgi:hypothetical protein